MATMAEARAAFNRQPIWQVIMKLDLCSNEYGVGACTASGGHCSYTWATCKDTTNYAQTTRDYKYTNRGAPYVAGALPLLTSFSPLSTRILQDKFEVSQGEMRLKFVADTAAPLKAMNKTGSTTDTGSYWPNLLARNPNYQGRVVEVYEGYATVAEALWELVFRGTLEDWQVSKDGAEITARDMLYKAKETKIPPKIDDENTVQDNPLTNVATTINVADSTQFLAASAKHPRCVKIESEYITYTAATSNQLTGCTRGAYGTSNVQHVQGTKIAQVLAYGTSTFAAGISPDLILYDLLYLADIDPSYWAVVDDGCVLDEALDDSETEFTITGGTRLPDSGVIKIDDEWCTYTTCTDTLLSGIVRGVWGSTAAAHDTASTVYVSTCTSEVGRWHAGATYRRKVEAETGVGDLIASLSADCMADTFVNEDGLVEFSLQAPPAIGTDATAITRDDQWLDSRQVDQYEESRCTRVYVYHSTTTIDPGENESDYTTGDLKVYIGSDAEAVTSYGSIRRRIRFCSWIWRSTEADWLASHLFRRYQRACPLVSFSLETYHAAIKVGDLINLTVPEIVDEDGAAEARTFRVIRREWRPERLNEIIIEAADTGYGGARYGLIAPAMPVLDEDLTDSEAEIDLDVSATTIVAADFRAGGQFRIGDELITIGGAVDWPGDVVRTFRCTRGACSSTPVAHSTGDQVLILFSGASDDFRREFAFIGAATTNYVDSDGDGTADTEGYRIF